MLVLRSLFFIALIPGTVAGVIPWLLLQSSGEAVRLVPLVPSLWLIGWLPLLAGLVLFFWCNGLFTFLGKGTLAPIDAPIFLVRAGPYHWIRNPMYVAVLTIILSEAILFHSLPVVGWALAFGTYLLLWVPLVEERLLREQFGASYETYLQTVPRWIPRWSPRRGGRERDTK
jgi:protein-S-isoprenylcysteine O-methyltransferase Ste14